MGRVDLSGPLEARNHLFGLIVQEPRRESLAFGDSLYLDGDRVYRDFEARKPRIADRVSCRKLISFSFDVPDHGIGDCFHADCDRAANTDYHKGDR